VCPNTYISCQYGVCSASAPVLLPGAVTSGFGGSVTTDDSYTPITVPFAIRLYSTTTTTVNVQSNGVSALLFDSFGRLRNR